MNTTRKLCKTCQTVYSVVEPETLDKYFSKNDKRYKATFRYNCRKCVSKRQSERRRQRATKPQFLVPGFVNVAKQNKLNTIQQNSNIVLQPIQHQPLIFTPTEEILESITQLLQTLV
jgi:hypothetical protein